MEGQNDRLYFEETQHFARWIRVIVLLPVAALGCLSLALFVEGSTRSALIPGGLALVFLLLAVPNWVMKLVTKLDARHLHLRLDPTGLPMPFLPPRVPLPHEHRDLEWNGSAAPAARRRANPCRIRSPRSARQRDHAGKERGPLVGRRHEPTLRAGYLCAMRLLQKLKRAWRNDSRHDRQPRRRDPSHVGRSSAKEIAEAPPGRAQELAGHATERVET